MGKHWIHSRTIWFNVASAMLIIGTEFAAFVEFIDPKYQDGINLALLILTVVGNTILRIVTTQPIR